MNKEDSMAILRAYEERHGGETIGALVASWGHEQYHHMVLVAEHFLHDQTISDAARLVGVSPQAASKICAHFKHHFIIFCQTIKRDPEKFLIPLLRATNAELETMVDWWTANKIRCAAESPPTTKPTRAAKKTR